MILLERRWERRLHCSPHPPFRANMVSSTQYVLTKYWIYDTGLRSKNQPRAIPIRILLPWNPQALIFKADI